MSYSSLGTQAWHMLTRDQTVLPATHMFIHKWNEPYLLHIMELECGPMPNVMAALPTTGGALCSTPQFG